MVLVALYVNTKELYQGSRGQEGHLQSIAMKKNYFLTALFCLTMDRVWFVCPNVSNIFRNIVALNLTESTSSVCIKEIFARFRRLINQYVV